MSFIYQNVNHFVVKRFTNRYKTTLCCIAPSLSKMNSSLTIDANLFVSYSHLHSYLSTYPHIKNPHYHASLVWSHIRRGINPLQSKTLSNSLQKVLVNYLNAQHTKKYTTIQDIIVSNKDSTIKLLIQLHDHLSIETVIMPNSSSTTVCVSTQVGCDRKCVFCATGFMGLIRNVDTEELASQIYFSRVITNLYGLPNVNRIVLMGMGDALCTIQHVKRCILEMIVNPHGFQIGKRKVTVSSVAPNPNSIRNAVESIPVLFGWSLHSVDDELRKVLVPSYHYSERNNVILLRNAFIESLKIRKCRQDRILRIAITLLDGMNDSEHDALNTVQFLRPFAENGIDICVDLIQYNSIQHSGLQYVLQKSPKYKMDHFQKILLDHNIVCFLRLPKGDDQNAACGQLSTGSFS
uniref:Radical SAM core domain-containing protein n=1 Tax=Timspurckia oligopyrenoides TaxID=708627 RepID=A0A7S0ZI49_9RHOD|mmetsp:Transcript_6244/g.11118  ORF Transcript_6244/g.11118 Transcript_6244/m.11118 type:complete len:407 (+) Transcript_6244:32-1252(+)